MACETCETLRQHVVVLQAQLTVERERAHRLANELGAAQLDLHTTGIELDAARRILAALTEE